LVFTIHSNQNTMAINIKLAPPIEERLKHKANRLGKSLDELILEILQEEAATEDFVATEEVLLQQVILGIPPEHWERYYALLKARDESRLTEVEHEELIRLSNEIEERNAKRMPFVFQLAEHRNTSPEALMQELGIQ